jgi:hypothetical protein
MISAHNNIGPGGAVRELSLDTYGMLEKLPPRLREIIQFAPYDYAATAMATPKRKSRACSCA